MHNHGLGAWMAKRRLRSPDDIALIHGEGDASSWMWAVYAVSGAAGTVAGVALLDLLMRRVGAGGVERLVGRGKFEKLKGQLERNTGWVVFLASALPPPFPFRFTMMTASALQCERGRMFVSVFLGRTLRFAAEALLRGRPGVFVTGWNPYSRPQPPGRNRRFNRALEQWLRRFPHWPGWGYGRGWREQHVLVRADPRRVTMIARRFRQCAVVLVAPPRPARLLLLPPRSPSCFPPAARWPARAVPARPRPAAGSWCAS